MPDNTVQADGQVLKRLRTEKGWSQEELAGRAIVSKKTVENIEAGKPTYAGTLAKLAKPLGVEAKQLLAPPHSNCDAEGVDHPRGEIEIVIKGDLDDYTEEKERELFRGIKKLLAISGTIRVINIREGSVVLTLELTGEQAKQLLQAVKAGSLAALGVVDARQVDPPKPAVTEPQAADSGFRSGLGSATSWISLLRAGDHAAAQPLWALYHKRLTTLARRKLRSMPRSVADAEDLALSAFESFFLAIEHGRYPQLSEQDIWPLLVLIMARLALDLMRRRSSKRGAAEAGLEDTAWLSTAAEPDLEDSTWGSTAAEPDLEGFLSREPTPEFAAEMADEFLRLIDRLGDGELRSIALWKMEGYTNAEIAQKLHCALRTVERKLRVIRSIWQSEIPP